MKALRWISIVGLVGGFWALAPETASADPVFEWAESEWRLELSAMTGLDSGRRDRTGDFTGNVVFEYEVPYAADKKILDRSTLGFRLRPLFYWRDSDADENIWGVGAGFSMRVYRHKETKSGFFGEVAEEVIWHSRDFDGNSTHVNVMSQFGVGYQSEKDWFLTLRFQHMSNASFGRRNAGINAVGVAAGFRF